jgi:hypothetical protein
MDWWRGPMGAIWTSRPSRSSTRSFGRRTPTSTSLWYSAIVSFRRVCSSGCSWRTDVAITIFAKLGAFLLSSKSYRAVLPSIFGFPRISSAVPSSPIRKKITFSARSCASALRTVVAFSAKAQIVGALPAARGRLHADPRRYPAKDHVRHPAPYGIHDAW